MEKNYAQWTIYCPRPLWQRFQAATFALGENRWEALDTLMEDYASSTIMRLAEGLDPDPLPVLPVDKISFQNKLSVQIDEKTWKNFKRAAQISGHAVNQCLILLMSHYANEAVKTLRANPSLIDAHA